VEHLRRATLIGLAASASLTLVGLVATAASAAPHVCATVLHAQLTNHLSSASTASSGAVLTNSNIMAAVVGLLALLALAFMVVTFIRRAPRES
jgi:hypothetical protein